MTITLKHIEQIMALQEYGNYRLAADKLRISQPALSRSIINLQEKLGVKLFDRFGGKLQPTRYGALVLERGKRILNDRDMLQRDISMLKGGETGVINIGCGPFPAEALAGEAIGRFSRLYPQITVRLIVDYAPRLTEFLLAQEIDFSVADTAPVKDFPEFEITPLPHQQLYFCCRKNHPLTAIPAPTIHDICAHPLAAMWAPDRIFTLFGKLLGKKIRSLEEIGRGLLVCDNLNTLLQMVSASDAFTSTSRAIFEQCVYKDRLQLLPLQVPELRTDYSIAQLRGRSSVDAVRDLQQCFIDTAEETARREETLR